MELVLLRALVTVAETGNVSLAAHRLSISQPALSKQIARVERAFGGAVFVRGRHGARLTELGHEILPSALDVLARADDLTARARGGADGTTGWLRVGFGMSSRTWAPQAVARFGRRHPQVHVTLDDLPSAVQRARLRRGELDVGFVRADAGDGLRFRRIGRDRLAVVTTAEPPGRGATARWLADRPLIRLRRERGPGLAGQIDALYRHHGVSAEVQQEADDLLTVLALVTAGVGEAIVPTSSAPLAAPGTTVAPIAGAVAGWDTGIAWSGRAPSAVVRNFLADALGQ